MHKLGRTSPRKFFAIKRCILAGAATLTVLMVSWSLGAPSRAQMPNVTPQGSWTMKAPLPSARGEVAAVALDGKLHAIGGSVDGKAVHFTMSMIRQQIPGGRALRCRRRATILPSRWPAERYLLSAASRAAVHKGAGTDAFEYDPAADRWRTLPPMKWRGLSREPGNGRRQNSCTG